MSYKWVHLLWKWLQSIAIIVFVFLTVCLGQLVSAGFPFDRQQRHFVKEVKLLTSLIQFNWINNTLLILYV